MCSPIVSHIGFNDCVGKVAGTYQFKNVFHRKKLINGFNLHRWKHHPLQRVVQPAKRLGIASMLVYKHSFAAEVRQPTEWKGGRTANNDLRKSGLGRSAEVHQRFPFFQHGDASQGEVSVTIAQGCQQLVVTDRNKHHADPRR